MDVVSVCLVRHWNTGRARTRRDLADLQDVRQAGDMTSQQWRTYALLLHLIAAAVAARWTLDNLPDPWRYPAAIFLTSWMVLGLIVPVTTDRTAGRHRSEE